MPLPQVNVDPEDLIPKLPKPRDLQPFPTTQALVNQSAAGGWGGSRGCPGGPSEVPCGCVGPSPTSCLPPQVYRGHTSLVRCLSISPSGQWLASGEDSLPRLGHPTHTRHQYPAPVQEQVPALPHNSAGLGVRVGWGCQPQGASPPLSAGAGLGWGAWARGRSIPELPGPAAPVPKAPWVFPAALGDPTLEPASLPLRSGESEAGGRGVNGGALRGRPEAGD